MTPPCLLQAKPDRFSNLGLTPLFIAACQGHLTVVRLPPSLHQYTHSLRMHGSISAPCRLSGDNHSRTRPRSCHWHGKVVAMMAHGANPDLKMEQYVRGGHAWKGVSAVQVAVKQGHEQVSAVGRAAYSYSTCSCARARACARMRACALLYVRYGFPANPRGDRCDGAQKERARCVVRGPGAARHDRRQRQRQDSAHACGVGKARCPRQPSHAADSAVRRRAVARLVARAPVSAMGPELDERLRYLVSTHTGAFSRGGRSLDRQY